MTVRRIVVMGPAASGKSTVGQALADALGVAFVDGDDLHPAANVARMSSGLPLRDEDRWPWLDAVGATLAASTDGVVVACSALRRAYRDRIRHAAPDAWVLELALDPAEAGRRAAVRERHFMPAALVHSQYAILEPRADGEAGCTVDATRPADAVVREALTALG